jgi:ferric-dicitrate binding protein FerR (iron transport regulator)
MNDLTCKLLFYDDLVPAERRAAREALDEDEDLARVAHRWQAARRRVAARFREALPERHLLVRYALATAPGAQQQAGAALTRAEKRELDGARPQIEAALDAHPALEDVVEQIRRERDAFEAAWDERAPAPDEAPGSNATASDNRRAADRPAATPDSGDTPKRRLLQRWGFRVAGALALVAFVAALFFVAQRDLSTVTVTVAEGEAPRTVTLADGSTARLMPGATLSYVDPEAGAALDRQATLKAGRAFFDIVENQDGFVLETPTAQVTVLGTRFGVRAEERATRVVLAFGRVTLAAEGGAGQPVTLRPGQASRVAAGARPATPTEVESLSEALAWTGLFFVRDTPVRRLADQLATRYGQTVRVAPPLRDRKVTGTFDRDRPLRETLQTVATALGARVEPVPGGGYRLVPSPGGP